MNKVDEYDYLYKIVLIGDANVGKTHILSKYIKNSLPTAPNATVGVEFATSTIPLSTGGTVKAQIWDTAGQEKYRSITSAHYRRAVGALLVYDVTRKESFRNVTKWLQDLKEFAEHDIVVTLIGNKVDLVAGNSSLREVQYEIAQHFAETNNLFFYEVSALTGMNVHMIFENLMQEIYNVKTTAIKLDDHELHMIQVAKQINLQREKENQKHCC